MKLMTQHSVFMKSTCTAAALQSCNRSVMLQALLYRVQLFLTMKISLVDNPVFINAITLPLCTYNSA